MTRQQAVQHVAEVVQAWLEYCAALQIHQLNQRGGSDTLRSGLDVATSRASLGRLMGTIGWNEDWQVTIPLPSAPASDPDLSHAGSPGHAAAAGSEGRREGSGCAPAGARPAPALPLIGALDVGVFRDQAIGGTPFIGPNVVIELPLLNHRIGEVLQADAELRIALRKLEAARLAARSEIRIHAAELQVMRLQLQQFGAGAPPVNDASYVRTLREYWRTRSALALSAGDWGTLSGL